MMYPTPYGFEDVILIGTGVIRGGGGHSWFLLRSIAEDEHGALVVHGQVIEGAVARGEVAEVEFRRFDGARVVIPRERIVGVKISKPRGAQLPDVTIIAKTK